MPFLNRAIANNPINVLNPGNGLEAVAEYLDYKRPDEKTEEGAKALKSILDFAATNTAAFQAILDYAAANKRGVYCPPNTFDKTYLVSSIRLKNGIQNLICEGLIKGTGTSQENGIIALDGPNIFGGTAVKNCYISLNIDMSWGDTFGIQADGCKGCIFENSYIYGLSERLPSTIAIILRKDSNYNKIINNKIEGFHKPTTGPHVLIAIFGEAEEYGGFFNKGVITPPITPCISNIISNNTLLYSDVAIDLLGCESNIVSNNYCYKQRTRAIYMAESTNNCIINSNNILGFGASAVLLGYGAFDNIIVNNICKQIYPYNGPCGEAAINVNTGAYGNLIKGNTIESFTHYGVYLAINSIDNIVDGNKISQHFLAAIALENDWWPCRNHEDQAPCIRDDKMYDKNKMPSLYSRPNYGHPPESGHPPKPNKAWASKDSRNNVIQNNVIGTGCTHRWENYPELGPAIAGGIYISQISQFDATGKSFKTCNNIIQNNIVTKILTQGFNLYFFEHTEGLLSNNILKNNSFHDATLDLSDWTRGRIYFTRGKDHFTSCIGNDVLDAEHIPKL